MGEMHYVAFNENWATVSEISIKLNGLSLVFEKLCEKSFSYKIG